MNSYYVTSQLVSDRQSALMADCRQRAQVKEARAARKATVAASVRPTRTRWLTFGRPAPATA
jgi:outer membrane protein TolC